MNVECEMSDEECRVCHPERSNVVAESKDPVEMSCEKLAVRI